MDGCKQRHQYDCFLAAVATVLERDYDELWPIEFQQRIEANEGSGNGLQYEAFQLIGLRKDIDYWSMPIIGIKVNYMEGLLQLFKGRRTLLQVPSLNDPGKSHLIVLRNNEVFDPSNKKTYATTEDITKVEWAILFNELDRV